MAMGDEEMMRHKQIPSRKEMPEINEVILNAVPNYGKEFKARVTRNSTIETPDVDNDS